MKKGLQVHITFITGELLVGDSETWEQTVKRIYDENPIALITEDQIEMMIEETVTLLSKIGSMKTFTIMVNGQTHGINPAHVLYVKIVRI